MAHVVIVYRHNRLFSRYIPKVAKTLQDDGHEVTVKVFREGARRGELSAYLAPEGSIIICDDTYCNAKWGFDGQIDSIFRRLTENAISGQIDGYYYKAEDIYRQTLNQLVAEALKNGASAPQKVSVARCKLRDHKGQLGWASDEAAADMVAGWFRQIFPDAAVETTAYAEMPTSASHWLVADRHHVENKEVKQWEELGQTGLVLRLPLETTHLDLALWGLVSKDEAKFESKLCCQFRSEVALELRARKQEKG